MEILLYTIIAILVVYIIKRSRSIYALERGTSDTLQRIRVSMKSQKDEEESLSKNGKKSVSFGCNVCGTRM
jgi:hypothetical protein